MSPLTRTQCLPTSILLFWVQQHLARIYLHCFVHYLSSRLYSIYEVCPENVQTLLIQQEQFADIDVTWQPRRMDWNVHV